MNRDELEGKKRKPERPRSRKPRERCRTNEGLEKEGEDQRAAGEEQEDVGKARREVGEAVEDLGKESSAREQLTRPRRAGSEANPTSRFWIPGLGFL